jgi:hypothetical protein
MVVNGNYTIFATEIVKNRVVKILGVFLFMVFLAGIVPKEYIHEAFFDHEDAMHPIYKKGEVVITKKHNHCSFLSFEFAPFVATEQQYLTFRATIVYTGYILPVYVHCYSAAFYVIALRGPPAGSVC